METPQFWDDLIDIGGKIAKSVMGERDQCAREYLCELNERLPANIYIPFFKEEIRLYTVLNVWLGRLFPTKERVPYSIWIEIYRETE